MGTYNHNNFPKVDNLSIEQRVSNIASNLPSKDELHLALSLIDLTTLEGKDDNKRIVELCKKAIDSGTAAVCVYPTLVKTARQALNETRQKVASVAGAFPSGQLPLKLRLEEAKFALEEGADEIDMVISRGKFLDGEYNFVYDEIAAFKNICGQKTLKVILETGELDSPDNIRIASDIALHAGADFIKTSTGKISVNATLSSVCVMLEAIKDFYTTSGKKCGIKPSGGISDGNTAVKYLRMTENILGKEWLIPDLFRFGASRLVDNLLAEINGKTNEISAGNGY